MFQQRPARATAETGGVISLHLSLFLPPAGLSFSLLLCHTLSLSHPFMSSVSLLPSCVCVSTVTPLSSLALQISRGSPSRTTPTQSQPNFKMVFFFTCEYMLLGCFRKEIFKKWLNTPVFLPLWLANHMYIWSSDTLSKSKLA